MVISFSDHKGVSTIRAIQYTRGNSPEENAHTGIRETFRSNPGLEV